MSIIPSRLRSRHRLLTALSAGLLACAPAADGAADTTDGTSALPAPGERIPDFTLPAFYGAGPASPKRFAGSVTALALWADVPYAKPAMAEFDSLARRFADVERVQFMVLTKHPVAPDDDEAFPTGIEHADVAAEAPTMLFIFGRPRLDAKPPADFKLPSFLLIDEQSRVLRRVQGLPWAVFAPVLDSIERAEKAAPLPRDAALADSMLAPLSAVFERFDAEGMRDPGDLVRYNPCMRAPRPTRALMPANLRLLEINPAGRTLAARVEVISIARLSLDSADHSSMCYAKRVRAEPVVTVDTLETTLTPAGNWWSMGDFSPGVLLVSRTTHRFNLQFSYGGFHTLRENADSVRAARRREPQ